VLNNLSNNSLDLKSYNNLLIKYFSSFAVANNFIQLLDRS